MPIVRIGHKPFCLKCINEILFKKIDNYLKVNEKSTRLVFLSGFFCYKCKIKLSKVINYSIENPPK